MITWTSFSCINRLTLRLYSKYVGCNLQLQKSKIEKNVTFILKRGSFLSIGENTLLRKNSELRAYEYSKLLIGNECIIDNGVRIISANKNKVELGDNVKIGFYSVLNGGGGIEIGENSSLYGFVYIRSSFHQMNKSSFHKKKYVHKKIIIKKGSLIEPHSIV